MKPVVIKDDEMGVALENQQKALDYKGEKL